VLAGFDSTGDVTVSTLVTLMVFALGVWTAGAAVATLGAAGDRSGLAFPVALDTAEGIAGVLTDAALTGEAGFEVDFVLAVVDLSLTAVGLDLTAVGLGLGLGLATGLATGLAAALAIATLALAAGAVAFLATADLPREFALFEVFTSCLLAVSKGRVLTVCPRAADPNPVHMLSNPCYRPFGVHQHRPKGFTVGGRL